MKRVVLVHWNVEEAKERATSLRREGYEVSCFTDPRGDPRVLRDDPPDAFVIDLGRMPSQGREVGGWLRRQKATRYIPLVFIEGDPEKTARVRALLPDAAYTVWEDASATIAEALALPHAEPVVPGAMDAYAGVSLAVRLGIADGKSVALLNAPAGFGKTLGDLSKGTVLLNGTTESAEVILLFETSVADLERDFTSAARRLQDGGRLWLAWPKKASGVKSDLSQTVVRAFGLERGFVDYKIASIDATWSALCFARRENGGKASE